MYEREPLAADHFAASRRDVMLAHASYETNLRGYVEGFDIHHEVPVSQHLGKGKDAEVLGPLSTSLAGLGWDTVAYLHLQYTAGESIEHLRAFYPETVSYWEEYAKYHEAFHKTPASPHVTAHLTLQDDSYWDAIRLTSFSILLGHTELMPRLCAIWDYGDQPLDSLLERLVAPFVPGRAPPPDKCTRHLPYFKLLKVFAAEPAKRPALMSKYMDEWYEASRREPYYKSHTKGREHSYLGYWSFEAAAVTYLLDIDDASYRDKDFYPRDLIDFARSLPRPVQLGGAPLDNATERIGLRAMAGQPCPREGWWVAVVKIGSRRHFKAGELMPDLKSDAGATIWQWDSKQ